MPGVTAHRSASACAPAFLEIRPECSHFLPISFGFFAPFQAHDGSPVLVGSHRPIRNSADTRIVRRRRTAPRRDAHSIGRRNRRNRRTRAAAAEVTGRPSDGHALLDGFPLGSPPATRPIHQNYGIPLCAHTDAARRLSAAGPRTRKVLTNTQPAFAMPAASVDRSAGLCRLRDRHMPGEPLAHCANYRNHLANLNICHWIECLKLSYFRLLVEVFDRLIF